MALLGAGFWHRRFFPSGFWHEDFWQHYPISEEVEVLYLASSLARNIALEAKLTRDINLGSSLARNIILESDFTRNIDLDSSLAKKY